MDIRNPTTMSSPPSPTITSSNASTLESQILTSYLLTPAPLPTILPLKTFLTLFPTSQRNNPQIRTLYRDLQFSRAIDIDRVRENIESEVRKGVSQRAALMRSVESELDPVPITTEKGSGQRKRKRSDAASTTTNNNNHFRSTTDSHDFEDEADVMIDTSIFLNDDPDTLGMVPARSTSDYHTLSSLLKAMEAACSDLEAEVDDAEGKCKTLLAEMKETVGGLSDLRYGKFASRVSAADGKGDDRAGGGGFEAEIVTGLKGLKEVCEQRM